MKRQQIDRYEGPKTVGIDVSHHNGQIAWKQVNTSFALVRTGDGKDIDTQVEANLKGATDHVPFVGTYRYLRADRGGEHQAELDLEIVAKSGVKLTLPMVGDVEEGIRKNLPGGIYSDSLGDVPAEVVAEEMLEYLELIERETGTRPMIYTGQFFHWIFSQSRPRFAAIFDKYALWVPSYGTPHPLMPVDKGGLGFPWDHWTFWQYTSSGVIKGINNSVDLNYFRGDTASLRAFANSRCVDGCSPSVVRDQLLQLAGCFQGLDDKASKAITDAATAVAAYETNMVELEARAERHRKET